MRSATCFWRKFQKLLHCECRRAKGQKRLELQNMSAEEQMKMLQIQIRWLKVSKEVFENCSDQEFLELVEKRSGRTSKYNRFSRLPYIRRLWKIEANDNAEEPTTTKLHIFPSTLFFFARYGSVLRSN